MQPETSPAEALLNDARAARGRGDVSACESLSSQALREAKAEGDGQTAYHAVACIGRARLARGEPELALDNFSEALAVAKELLHPSWLAMAHHDVFLAAREAGLELCARRHLYTAADLYRDFRREDEAGLLGLLADAAQMEADRHPSCMERARIAQDAWKRVEPAPRLPLYAFNAHAQSMRAAAVLGEEVEYRTAAQRLESAFAALPDHEHGARTLVYAAESALLANDFTRALSLSQRALTLAQQRGENWLASFARTTRAAALAETTAARLN